MSNSIICIGGQSQTVNDVAADEIMRLRARVVAMTEAKNKAVEALKECVTDHNAFCLASDSREAAHRRISAINQSALAALKELEAVK